MHVKLTKRGSTWVTEFMGKERHFVMDNDLVTWRSLGILPSSAVLFETHLDGSLISATEVVTGNELESLEVPAQHVVAKMIRPTKAYIS